MTARVPGKAGHHIIWQNENRSITIIDIPRSIEDAQHEDDSTSSHRLISSPPPTEPYSLPEPKSDTARARLILQHPELQAHRSYAILCERAFQEIRTLKHIVWAYDRVPVDRAPWAKGGAASSRSRKRRSNSMSTTALLHANPDQIVIADGVVGSEDHGRADFTAALDLDNWPAIANISHQALRFKLDIHGGPCYLMPPNSTALCHKITMQDRGALLRQTIRHRCGNSARFHLVVLDPPWHNASVKRSQHYSTMNTQLTADLLVATDLEMLMADQCLVCTWVTNKPFAREAVLGEDGVFASWGVQLIEEWVWFKVTTKGELVFPLDTVMRKPYEVLLVGRKHRTYPVPPAPADMTRRALFAVPDLHSRKPCLKTLIQPLLLRSEENLTLEVFARHLVAGWWSLGDECLLFNERLQWTL